MRREAPERPRLASVRGEDTFFPGGDSHSECPLCGCPFTHLGAVQVDAAEGDDAHAVAILCGEDQRNAAISTELFEPQNCGRGSAVSTWRWCESGCSWIEVLSFRKGETFRYGVPLDGPRLTEDTAPPELWRD
jgi:hypothetical protein